MMEREITGGSERDFSSFATVSLCIMTVRASAVLLLGLLLLPTWLIGLVGGLPLALILFLFWTIMPVAATPTNKSMPTTMTKELRRQR